VAYNGRHDGSPMPLYAEQALETAPILHFTRICFTPDGLV